MDPLGTILEAFANYFTPPFLAIALVIGYLMFFLFFYKTEYWDSVDWMERFFFGFLVGMFSMIACNFVFLPLAFLLFSLYLEQWFTTAFYFIPIFLLVFLVFLRVELGALGKKEKEKSNMEKCERNTKSVPRGKSANQALRSTHLVVVDFIHSTICVLQHISRRCRGLLVYTLNGF
jgi:uncharacterized membrane protein